jgi:predicted outer membrane protein
LQTTWQQALALIQKLHVTPQNNPTSQALLKQAAEERRKLAQLPQFDGQAGSGLSPEQGVGRQIARALRALSAGTC